MTKLNTAIPVDMIVNQVEHLYAGNVWAVVAARPGGWMDLIGASKITPGSQIFHVWDKLVSLEKKLENQGTAESPRWVKSDQNVPIHPEIIEKVQDIRERLASGLWVIKNTRLVKAT